MTEHEWPLLAEDRGSCLSDHRKKRLQQAHRPFVPARWRREKAVDREAVLLDQMLGAPGREDCRVPRRAERRMKFRQLAPERSNLRQAGNGRIEPRGRAQDQQNASLLQHAPDLTEQLCVVVQVFEYAEK